MRLLLVLVFALASTILYSQNWLSNKPNRLLKKGDTTKTLEVINKRVSRHPKASQLYLLRSRIKIEAGELEEALIDLNTVKSLEGESQDNLINRALILYKLGRYNPSLNLLLSYAEEAENSRALSQIGLCYLHLEQHNIALGYFIKSLNYGNPSHQVLYNIGWCALQIESFAQATDYFRQATEKLPGDYYSWLGLGVSLQASAEYKESNKALRQANAVSPNNAQALYNIGVNYYHMDDMHQCCSYWSKAIDAGSLAAKTEKERYCEQEQNP